MRRLLAIFGLSLGVFAAGLIAPAPASAQCGCEVTSVKTITVKIIDDTTGACLFKCLAVLDNCGNLAVSNNCTSC